MSCTLRIPLYPPNSSLVPPIGIPKTQGRQRTDVPPQDILDLLLLEPTADDQPPAAVHATRCAHLREHKGDNMLRLTMHAPADVTNVGEYRALVSVPVDRGRCEGVPLRTGERESGICGVERAEEAI